MTFENILYLFKSKHCAIDETSFYFAGDDKKTEHFIGCIPGDVKPYWIGFCDIADGATFASADEMFDAKVFDGRSLKDRWDDVVLLQIGNLDVGTWMEHYGACIASEQR